MIADILIGCRQFKNNVFLIKVNSYVRTSVSSLKAGTNKRLVNVDEAACQQF